MLSKYTVENSGLMNELRCKGISLADVKHETSDDTVGIGLMKVVQLLYYHRRHFTHINTALLI